MQGYHDVENYLAAMAQGCASDCAYTQYKDCGNGWTPEDEADFDVNYTDLTDAELLLDASSAQSASTSPGGGGGGAPTPPSGAALWGPGAGIVAMLILLL